MKTPQILTGQQAIDQFGLNALIECRVAVTTDLNGLGHSVMQIGVIADPDSCFIDLSDEPALLYVEIEQDDDFILHPIMGDEQFVLLDDKNQPESNAVLSERIADLTRQNSGLQAQVEQLRNASYAAVMFIKNGVALGFIRMPDNDVPDPAHRTLPNLCAALDATPAQCLAEVRAQAVRDFCDTLGGYQDVYPLHKGVMVTSLAHHRDGYLEQLLQKRWHNKIRKNHARLNR